VDVEVIWVKRTPEYFCEKGWTASRRFARRGWARTALGGWGGFGSADCEPWQVRCLERPQDALDALQGHCESVYGQQKYRCHAGDKSLEPKNVEHAGKVVAALRHVRS
jgi:hypothetical protein